MVVKMSDYMMSKREINEKKKILRTNAAVWFNKMCSINTQVYTHYYQW